MGQTYELVFLNSKNAPMWATLPIAVPTLPEVGTERMKSHGATRPSLFELWRASRLQRKGDLFYLPLSEHDSCFSLALAESDSIFFHKIGNAHIVGHPPSPRLRRAKHSSIVPLRGSERRVTEPPVRRSSSYGGQVGSKGRRICFTYLSSLFFVFLVFCVLGIHPRTHPRPHKGLRT